MDFPRSGVISDSTVEEEDSVSYQEHEDKVKENIGICITISGIILVAVVVTTIKIMLFDKETYPSVFYSPEELQALRNKTVSFQTSKQMMNYESVFAEFHIFSFKM